MDQHKIDAQFAEIARAENVRDMDEIKQRARAVAAKLEALGYDVFVSYGHAHGLTEWDVYEAGNGTPAGLIGSVWYDSCGVILKGDRLCELTVANEIDG